MNELLELSREERRSWLCSGQDSQVLEALLKSLSSRAVREGRIRLIIAAEDMLPAVRGLSGPGPSFFQEGGENSRTSWGYFPLFGGSHVENLPEGIIRERLHTLMRLYRPDSPGDADLVLSLLDFAMELEKEGFHRTPALDESFLRECARTFGIEVRLEEAVSPPQGFLREEEYEVWLAEWRDLRGRGGRGWLKSFLQYMDACFGCDQPRRLTLSEAEAGALLCFPVREGMREKERKILFQQLEYDLLDARRAGREVMLLVLEGAGKFGQELPELFERTGAGTVPGIDAGFFAKDLFAGHGELWIDQVTGFFDSFVYTAHASMKSCEMVSRRMGTFPVVRTSTGYDQDRRIGAGSVLDRLLGTDRVDHYTTHVPQWEPRYRSEEIHQLPPGVCLVQAGGLEGYLSI